jgi:hypothetical protein
MYRTDAIPSATPASAPTSTMAKISTVTRPRDASGRRADGHANADLAPPLQHGIVQHAIQADGREQQRDRREEQRQHGQQPLAHGLRPHQIRLRADVVDAELGPRGTSRRSMDASAMGFALAVRTMKVAPRIGSTAPCVSVLRIGT